MLKVIFQGNHCEVVIVIVDKAPVSLTSVFKTGYPLDLEEADFDGQSFQNTYLNTYFFNCL